MAVTNWRLATLAVAFVVVGATTSAAQAQAKWWWEKYPSATNKALDLRNATGGQVTAKQNATGTDASVSGNSATQPPTVIIQQTASSAAATPSGFCVNPSTAYYDPSYGASAITTSTCASLPGHQVTTMTSPSNAYNRSQGVWFYPITACCYTPTGTVGAGAPSYTPWANSNYFNANGYAGTQHQDFITPGSYSFTIPNGVYRIWVSAVGGGGGGGQGASSYHTAGYNEHGGGGGGRAGIVYRIPLDVIPGTVASILVGRGGDGAPTANSSSTSSPPAGSPGQGSYVVAGTQVVTVQGGFSGPGGYNSRGNRGQDSVAGSIYYASAGNPTRPTESTQGGGLPGYVGSGQTSGVSVGPGQAGGGQGGSGYNSTNNGEGNNYNQSGAGIGGGANTWGVSGGGGGAAGFIGMPWSTNVPSGLLGGASNAVYSNAACYTKAGAGGFGYGAGGGGGAGVGWDICGSSSNTNKFGGAGGKGADGAVWLEW